MDTNPLIDLHSHFLTRRYLEAARAAGHGNPDGMPWWPTWDVSDRALHGRMGH